MNDFLLGISTYLTGLRAVAKHGLWGYLLLPILLTFIVAALLLTSGWAVSDDLGGYLVQWYPYERGSGLVTTIASVLSGSAVVVLGLLLFRYIIIILCAPVLSILSEKLEKKLNPNAALPPFSIAKFTKDIVRGVTLSVRNISRELLFTIPLLLLGLIPFLTPFTTVLVFAIQAYYAGFGNIDFLLERRYSFRESISFVRRNKMLALGNGVVYMGLLLIGIGFLIAPTLGTVAATVAALDRVSPTTTAATEHDLI